MAAPVYIGGERSRQIADKVTKVFSHLGTPTTDTLGADQQTHYEEWQIKGSGMARRTRIGDTTLSVSVQYLGRDGKAHGAQVTFTDDGTRAFSYEQAPQTQYMQTVTGARRWAHFKQVMDGVRFDPIPRVNTSLLPQESGPARKASPVRR